MRIGMGYKALFAANSLGYWQEKQRRRPPESVLPQSARSCAEHPQRSAFSAALLPQLEGTGGQLTFHQRQELAFTQAVLHQHAVKRRFVFPGGGHNAADFVGCEAGYRFGHGALSPSSQPRFSAPWRLDVTQPGSGCARLRPAETMAVMSDESQIEVPPSFIALFVPPGRIKPTASREHIRQRYELCEDMASMFVDTAQTKLWELGISESDVLERIHAGLVAGAGGVGKNEAQWAACRLTKLSSLEVDASACQRVHLRSRVWRYARSLCSGIPHLEWGLRTPSARQ
jgi:hypothetical protein